MPKYKCWIAVVLWEQPLWLAMIGYTHAGLNQMPVEFYRLIACFVSPCLSAYVWLGTMSWMCTCWGTLHLEVVTDGRPVYWGAWCHFWYRVLKSNTHVHASTYTPVHTIYTRFSVSLFYKGCGLYTQWGIFKWWILWPGWVEVENVVVDSGTDEESGSFFPTSFNFLNSR